MRKLFFLSAVLFFAGILILLFVFSSQRHKTSDKEYYQAFNRNYKIFNPFIPDSVSFSGESVPLENILSRESFDRELMINTYWHTNTILAIKRANRWFPVIVPILKKNDVPEDFKYLALIESGLMNVVSPKGAAGFWQFIEETGKIHGLEINKEIDERYHVEKSTEAACKYLKDSYSEFGSWTLVAASYNAGKKRIRDAIEKQQINNYYDLFLNEETSRYIFRIVAFKTIYEFPTRYGYYIRESDLYPVIPCREISVSEPVADLVSFAGKNNINYKILKEFNPWLKSEKLTNSTGKTYIIKIPENLILTSDSNDPDNWNKIFNDTVLVNEIR